MSAPNQTSSLPEVPPAQRSGAGVPAGRADDTRTALQCFFDCFDHDASVLAAEFFGSSFTGRIVQNAIQPNDGAPVLLMACTRAGSNVALYAVITFEFADEADEPTPRLLGWATSQASACGMFNAEMQR